MKHGFLWSFTDDSKCATFLFLLEFQKKKKKKKKKARILNRKGLIYSNISALRLLYHSFFGKKESFL